MVRLFDPLLGKQWKITDGSPLMIFLKLPPPRAMGAWSLEKRTNKGIQSVIALIAFLRKSLSVEVEFKNINLSRRRE